MNLYVTPIEYMRAPTGQETASLLGNVMRLSGAVIVGATTLTVTTGLTVALNQYDMVTIFDGGNSEAVQLTAGAIAGATTLSVAAIQFAHAAGTVMCSDGTRGSLAQAIEVASATLESICQQSLLLQPYTETYTLRTMDAAISNDNVLSIRPQHFPVNAVTALSVSVQNGNSTAISVAQVVLDARARLVAVPNARPYGNGAALNVALGQQTPGYVTMGYTAGFTYGTMPMDIKQAAIMLTSDTLSDRLNPTGAADLRLGQRQASTYLRGDLSGQSALYKRATALLQSYTKVK